MSLLTKRKHVMNEDIWSDFYLPKGNQSVVKVLNSIGNNVHEVATPAGEEYLVSMPTKFRRCLWLKRGDYIIVEPAADLKLKLKPKVRAQIVKIINKDSIKYYVHNNVWPKEFGDKMVDTTAMEDNKFVNTNRHHETLAFCSSDSSDDCDSDSDSV